MASEEMSVENVDDGQPPRLEDLAGVTQHQHRVWWVCTAGSHQRRGEDQMLWQIQASDWQMPKSTRGPGLYPVAHQRWHLLVVICSHPVAPAASYVPGALCAGKEQSNKEYLHRLRRSWVSTKAFDEELIKGFCKIHESNINLVLSWAKFTGDFYMPWIVAIVGPSFLNPWCLSVKMLRWSKYLMLLLCTVYSSTLQATEVSETGL